EASVQGRLAGNGEKAVLIRHSAHDKKASAPGGFFMLAGDIFQNHLSQNFLFFSCRESFWQALMLNQPIEVA
ncbi:hypothetical protein, partial [Serratia marcescens]|uniref:hypothetical protein n=1 Tax=Serratia marcescens TaxID=615 RepID=UPI0023802481